MSDAIKRRVAGTPVLIGPYPPSDDRSYGSTYSMATIAGTQPRTPLKTRVRFGDGTEENVENCWVHEDGPLTPAETTP